jgi:hypothetical protein
MVHHRQQLFPRDQRTFDRCNGGWFGICFLFGTTTHFYWRGKFEWMPKLDTTAPTGAAKSIMPQRRYIDGAELAGSTSFGEGGSGNMTDVRQQSRVATPARLRLLGRPAGP